MQGYTPLEKDGQQGEVDDLGCAGNVPRRVVGQTQHAVAKIPVFSHHIGMGVMVYIVNLTPGVTAAGGVPLKIQ